MESKSLNPQLSTVSNRRRLRSRAFACSVSRSFDGEFVTSDASNFLEAIVISSMAISKASAFAADGLLNPPNFLTNCTAAARISSSVAGGAKLCNCLIFRHITNKCLSPLATLNKPYAEFLLWRLYSILSALSGSTFGTLLKAFRNLLRFPRLARFFYYLNVCPSGFIVGLSNYCFVNFLFNFSFH